MKYSVARSRAIIKPTPSTESSSAILAYKQKLEERKLAIQEQRKLRLSKRKLKRRGCGC